MTDKGLDVLCTLVVQILSEELHQSEADKNCDDGVFRGGQSGQSGQSRHHHVTY